MNEEKKEIGEGLPGSNPENPAGEHLFIGGDGGSGRRFCARVRAVEDGDESLLVLRQVHSSSRAAKTFSLSPHMFTLPAMLPLHLPPPASTRASRHNDADWGRGESGGSLSVMNNTLVN